MKTIAITMALLAPLLFHSGTAGAGDRPDTATVIGLYVEQAPGVLAEAGLVRGRGGPQWAEIRREGATRGAATEMVRIPPGVALRAGDRVRVAGRAEPSASAGAGAPSRVPVEPHLERPIELPGLRAPVTRPLTVMPGSCIPL